MDGRVDEPWEKAGTSPEPETVQAGELQKTEAEKSAKHGTELRYGTCYVSLI